MIIAAQFRPRSDDQVRFDTYRFYLRSFASFLTDVHADWEMFGRAWASRVKQRPRMSTVDEDWLRRFLRLAWNTEHLLSIDAPDVEMARVSNQWLPVQAYYAVYSAAEAFTYCLDGHKAEGHVKTLRKASDWLVHHGPEPWNLCYRGARGRGGNDANPVNFPPGLTLPSNLQRVGVQPIRMIGRCLKAEHSHRIDDSWRRGVGQKKYAFQPSGPTTLLHFLYRLRLKANYGDVDLFLVDASDSEIQGFGNHLREICFWTLMLFEIETRHRVGPPVFDRLAEDYLVGNAKATRLQMRMTCYRGAG